MLFCAAIHEGFTEALNHFAIFSAERRSRREERRHEQPNWNYADGNGCRQQTHPEGPALNDLLFDHNRRRDARLAVRVRMDCRCNCEKAIGLI